MSEAANWFIIQKNRRISRNMNAAYDLIAAAARYWFIALAALILFQLI